MCRARQASPDASHKLYWFYNDIRVPSFILSGAPFANKTTNFCVSRLLACDNGCEAGLVADDLDLLCTQFLSRPSKRADQPGRLGRLDRKYSADARLNGRPFATATEIRMLSINAP